MNVMRMQTKSVLIFNSHYSLRSMESHVFAMILFEKDEGLVIQESAIVCSAEMMRLLPPRWSRQNALAQSSCSE